MNRTQIAILVGVLGSSAGAQQVWQRDDHPASGEQRPQRAVAGDLDGDGQADLVVAHSGVHEVTVHLGQGDGNLQLRPRTSSACTPRLAS